MGSFLKNTTYSFLSKVSTMIFGIIFSILYTRFFGIENYGIISLAQSFITLVYTFTNLGFPQSLPYFIPKYRDKKLLNKIYKILILISAIISIIVFMLSDFIYYNFYSNIKDFNIILKIVAVFGLLPTFVNFLGVYSLQGLQKFKLVFYKNLLFGILRFIPIIIFIIFSNFIYAFSEYLFNFVILTIFLTLAVYNNTKNLNEKNTKLKTILKYSLTYFISSIFAYFFIQVDYLILGLYSSYLVGLFSIVHLFRKTLMTFAISLNEVIFPKATEEKRNKNKNFLRGMKYSFIITSFLSLLTIFAIEPILILLYGIEMLKIANVIKLIMIISILDSLFYVYKIIPYVINKPNVDMISNIVKAFSNVILCFIFIPLYGLYGIIISLTVNVILGYITTFILLKKEKYNLLFIDKKELIKYLIISVISTIHNYIIWVIFNNIFYIIPSISISLVLFLVLIKKFGDEEDKLILNKYISYIKKWKY